MTATTEIMATSRGQRFVLVTRAASEARPVPGRALRRDDHTAIGYLPWSRLRLLFETDMPVPPADARWRARPDGARAAVVTQAPMDRHNADRQRHPLSPGWREPVEFYGQVS